MFNYFSLISKLYSFFNLQLGAEHTLATPGLKCLLFSPGQRDLEDAVSSYE